MPISWRSILHFACIVIDSKKNADFMAEHFIQCIVLQYKTSQCLELILKHIVQCNTLRSKISKNVDFMAEHLETIHGIGNISMQNC